MDYFPVIETDGRINPLSPGDGWHVDMCHPRPCSTREAALALAQAAVDDANRTAGRPLYRAAAALSTVLPGASATTRAA